MTRHHFPAVLIAYAAITLLTAFITLGVSKESAGVVVLSTFVGCLLSLAAQSHFAWQDAREKRRESRATRIHAKKSNANVEAKPFRDRLTHFAQSHKGESETDTGSPHSAMPFRSVIEAARATPRQPKSANFIRRILLRIRDIVRGTDPISVNGRDYS